MRIAITADPFIPVPPENYGGIERVIDFLVTGLIERRHDVVLVANAASTVNAKLLPYSNAGRGWAGHIRNIGTIASLGKFKPDIIHSFSRLIYLLPFLHSSIPKIMSYQREPTLSQIQKVVRLAKKDSIAFTGCSNYISGKIKPFAPSYTVYNGVDMSKYQFVATTDKDAPLVFLGRIEPIKGIKTAIEVALSTQKKLKIAGNIPGEYASYFEKEIRPLLNSDIEYMGPVNDVQKNELLGNCSALLMPIDWDEPFGIVMAEAMACGTPVIGFNKGSVPEVIRNGINGYGCDGKDQMAGLVSQIEKIDRRTVRQDAEKRFSADVIIDEYLKIYNMRLS